MAIIRPMRGLRPPKHLAAKVAAPPYDVLNSDEARELAQGNEMSFLHINKPEIDLPKDVSLYDDAVYAKAVENVKRFQDEGWLVTDKQAMIYLYKQVMGDHEQVGIMASSAVDDYDNDIIKKHEKTRKEKEDDRARHVYDTRINAGPVFLTFRAQDALNALMDEVIKADPEVDFVAEDGIRHVLWPVSDETMIAKFVKEFESVPLTYVADGHHRAKSGSRARAQLQAANPNHTGNEEYNFFLSVLFPHDQLKILGYHRVVQDLNGYNAEEFLKKIKEIFDVTPGSAVEPEVTHLFRMYLDGTWYTLEARQGSYDEENAVESLDVAILQNQVLSPILGIEDPRTDKRIDFVGGIRGMKELEKRCAEGWALAFALHPTTVEQLMDVADAGLIMPPKSTWFEPKLRSGLVVHTLED